MDPAQSQAKPGATLADRIGKTPLVRLEQPLRGLRGVALLGKAEWANPGGSVKDRAAVAMVRDAIARKHLRPGKTLLDAALGNTGISFAMLGAALGFPVALAMPSSLSPERKQLLAALGAQVEWTSAADGQDGAIRRAREMAGNHPERYCYVDQYSNDANWLAHYQTTGPEIWEQTAGQVTHFVAGVGTSGTFMGAARHLKERNPLLLAYSVHPAVGREAIEGLKDLDNAIIPPIYNPHLASGKVIVEVAAAEEMAVRLAREEGLVVGLSAAAAVWAAARIAREEAEEGREAVVVAILPDSGERSLSLPFWSRA